MQKETDTNLKTGLFGGTFNPVHLGHLRAAEEIREKFDLAKIIFIPAHIPPHKKSCIIPFDNRFEMVKSAVEGNPFFEVSEIELKRKGDSYSFETIDYFNNIYKNRIELFFIMGLDAFREIQAWKKYPHFFSACHFIIMSRPGAKNIVPEKIIPHDLVKEFTYNSENKCFIHTSGRCIHYCQITFLEISSTAIRRRLGEGKSIKYLVASSVEQYIKKYNLYK